jgi:predicted nucleotidyltransferase
MATRDAIRNNLQEFGVTAAILFGSFIEQKEYRDIDVLIVLEEMADTSSIVDALCVIDADIDPTFVTTAALEENLSIGNPFYLNVLKGEPIIGSGYVERCRRKAAMPSGEVVRRYFDFALRAYGRAKWSKEYFDCYVACKFLIEHLMMKKGVYVTDPHRYDSYLSELDLPLDRDDAGVISRILMHRRGDVELCEGDIERTILILGERWFDRV